MVGEPGERSIDRFAAEQQARVEALERKLARAKARAERTVRAGKTEFDMARQLDALLAPVGYHCRHDCHWPGARVANLDHVLIGPGGVFVVDDKYYSSEVRTGSDGRVWAGRYPFEKEIDKAQAQAAALTAALNEPVTPILAVHGSEVSAPSLVRGVHLLAARDVPGLIQRQPARLVPERVAALAQSDVLIAAVSSPPQLPQKGSRSPGPTVRMPSPSSARKAQSRRSTRRSGFGVEDVLRLVLAVGLMTAAWFFLQPKVDPPAPPERIVHTESFDAAGISVESSYACSPDGVLRHVVGLKEGAITAAERALVPEGPWTPMEVISGRARAVVPPGQSALVQFHRAGLDGTSVTSMITSVSPPAGCS